jgi:hypothetical protein
MADGHVIVAVKLQMTFENCVLPSDLLDPDFDLQSSARDLMVLFS